MSSDEPNDACPTDCYQPAIDGPYWVDTADGPEVWLWDQESWRDFSGTVLTPEQAEARFGEIHPCVTPDHIARQNQLSRLLGEAFGLNRAQEICSGAIIAGACEIRISNATAEVNRRIATDFPEVNATSEQASEQAPGLQARRGQTVGPEAASAQPATAVQGSDDRARNEGIRWMLDLVLDEEASLRERGESSQANGVLSLLERIHAALLADVPSPGMAVAAAAVSTPDGAAPGMAP